MIWSSRSKETAAATKMKDPPEIEKLDRKPKNEEVYLRPCTFTIRGLPCFKLQKRIKQRMIEIDKKLLFSFCKMF
jgi:hypothetical protein